MNTAIEMLSPMPISCYEFLDTLHGRVVERRMQVFAVPPALANNWAGLAAFVAVEHSGVR